MTPGNASPTSPPARTRLKWQPTVELREGLEHTIRYFDRLLSSPEPAAHAIRNSVKVAQIQALTGADLGLQAGQVGQGLRAGGAVTGRCPRPR